MFGSIFSTFVQFKRLRLICGVAAWVLVMSAGLANLVFVSAQTSIRRQAALTTAPVDVTAPTVFRLTPSTIVIPITASDITGNGIIAFQFHILYDPLVVNPSGANFGCSTSGTIAGAAGLSPTCNVAAGDAGRLQVSVSGVGPMTGSGTILKITFVTNPISPPGSFSPLTFQNVFFYNLGGEFANVPHNGRINLVGPTAASVSVSGRILSSDGRGITNATVTVNGVSLSSARVVTTGRTGQYIIDDLTAGETYVINVGARRHTFATPSRLLDLTDNLADVDFIAN